MRSRIQNLLVVFGLAASAAGCSKSVTLTPLNGPPKPMSARQPAFVEMYTTAPPTRPYVEVYQLHAYNQTSEENLYEMRVKAAELGCDALITKEGAFQGTCVMWDDPPAPAALAH